MPAAGAMGDVVEEGVLVGSSGWTRSWSSGKAWIAGQRMGGPYARRRGRQYLSNRRQGDFLDLVPRTLGELGGARLLPGELAVEAGVVMRGRHGESRHLAAEVARAFDFC